MDIGKDYSEIVRQCFARGEPDWEEWDDYPALGFTSAHVPELIHILDTTSQIWDQAGEEDRIEWAPIHAWRALAQLKAAEALPAILRLHAAEGESDWVGEETPVVLSRFGPPVLADLRSYVCDPKHETWTRVGVAHAMALIARDFPESRTDCIAALCAGLESFEQNDEVVNGFIISYLVDVHAPEAASLVERAFQSGRVDLSITGDYEEFQIAVGLLKERLTPPPKYGWFMPDIRKSFVEYEEQMKKKQRQAEKKEKAKQKREKKARKRSRKKK